jgi:hypothetical protein
MVSGVRDFVASPLVPRSGAIYGYIYDFKNAGRRKALNRIRTIAAIMLGRIGHRYDSFCRPRGERV